MNQHQTRLPLTNRRQWLRSTACATGVAIGLPRWANAAPAGGRGLPPTRVITRGPKHHWFADYDKWKFDPTDRSVLGREADFEHRSPRPDDVIKIGMVDLQQDDRWIELGESSAWGWQQGCMLQWIPGSASRILWNDREGDRYVCRILDVQTGEKQTSVGTGGRLSY